MDGIEQLTEQRVLDALPNAVCALDLEGRIAAVNRAWSRVATALGAPEPSDAEAIRGRSLADTMTELLSREQLEHAMSLLRAGRVEVVTWERALGAGDETRVFLVQLTAMREQHAPAGFVCSVVDVTASRRAHDALMELGTALARPIELERISQELTQQLRRVIPHDAFVFALADESTGALRVCCRSGYDEPDDALAARLAPQWRAALDSARVHLQRAGGVVELTAPVRASGIADGAVTVRIDDVGSAPQLDEAARVLRTVAEQTAVAIERSAYVGRVGQRQRLDAIGDVTARIADELRNSLFAISSAAQLLRFRAHDDPVLERNVARILREAERLNGMAAELLAYGRPKPLRFAREDPDAVWDEVLAGNRGVLESRSLTLARTRATPPAAVRADAARLAQLFVNILVNAAEAAPPGSDLGLRSWLLPNGSWRCALHDGGAGIPSDALPRIFDVLFSTKAGRAGIGLALCRRIIDEHDGTIAVESETGRGTTVTVTLPPAP